MFNFLQYGTTAQVARATGAGEHRVARKLGAQALWLSLAVGIVLAVAIALLAGPIVALVGVDGRTADQAATYLRIVAIGIPSFFLALGGQGYLRGVSELRAPLVLIVPATSSTSSSSCSSSTASTGGSRARPGAPRSRRPAWAQAFVWLIVRRVGRDDLAPVVALARRAWSRSGSSSSCRTVVADRRLPARRRGRRPPGRRRARRVPDLLPALDLPRARARRDRDRRPDHRRPRARCRAARAGVRGERPDDRPRRRGRDGVRGRCCSRSRSRCRALFSGDEAVLAQCALLWPIFALMQPSERRGVRARRDPDRRGRRAVHRRVDGRRVRRVRRRPRP